MTKFKIFWHGILILCKINPRAGLALCKQIINIFQNSVVKSLHYWIAFCQALEWTDARFWPFYCNIGHFSPSLWFIYCNTQRNAEIMALLFGGEWRSLMRKWVNCANLMNSPQSLLRQHGTVVLHAITALLLGGAWSALYLQLMVLHPPKLKENAKVGELCSVWFIVPKSHLRLTYQNHWECSFKKKLILKMFNLSWFLLL